MTARSFVIDSCCCYHYNLVSVLSAAVGPLGQHIVSELILENVHRNAHRVERDLSVGVCYHGQDKLPVAYLPLLIIIYSYVGCGGFEEDTQGRRLRAGH